jgi:alanine racemase
MALILRVDGERWRRHLRAVLDAHPGLVPVAKGNGYGFGVDRLAREAASQGADMLAVGTYGEVAAARKGFSGPILVLSPWRPFESGVAYDERVVHTVGRLADLESLAARDDRPRLVLERMTSMRRHGFSAAGLREASAVIGDGVSLDGVCLHLPMASGSHLPEVTRLMTDIVAADLPTSRVFVSHLTNAELARLRRSYPDYEFLPRVGTVLWLGDREALRVTATVLDRHPVQRGDRYGYRGRAAPRAGTILVVSGGTAHGVGLEAPAGGASLRQRAAALARGALDAAGVARSPYTVDGRQRLFAEPPHMQASMLFLPAGARPPDPGDEVEVRVRFTATTFDETVFE